MLIGVIPSLGIENMTDSEGLSERDKAVLRSIFDPSATIGDIVDEGDTFLEDDEEPVDENWRKSRELCARGVTLAEGGRHEDALQVLNEAVAAAPQRAAAYNDRAQLLRLLQKDDEALSDLEEALRLTEGRRGRARAQCLCQRGVLRRKRGETDGARADFAAAAILGSGFARKQVVELNPYAALCNQMLSQVMKGESDIKI